MTFYGLFKCDQCGREELKRVPVYRANVAHNYQTRELISIFGEFVTLGGRITYDCVAPFYGNYDYALPCDGEMVLDTRYNFAGCLQGEHSIDAETGLYCYYSKWVNGQRIWLTSLPGIAYYGSDKPISPAPTFSRLPDNALWILKHF